MKLLINRNLLLNSLGVVEKIVNAKSSIPALSGVFVKIGDDKITLITSNMEQSIKYVIENDDYKIEDDGECLIPGKIFFDFVKKLNGDQVDLELEQDNILRVISGSSDITINLLDVQDYPQPNFEEVDEPVVMSSALLKEVIKQTTFAASEGAANKPILTGVNFKFYDDKLSAVSTDSYRISKRVCDLKEKHPEINIIIPAKSLNELSRVITDDAGEVSMFLGRGRVLFKFDNIVFQTRLLEGNYPDTNRLIPSAFPTILKFNKLDLLESIDRVSTMTSNANTSTTVKLRVSENGTVMLSSNSPELGTIKDVINLTEAVIPYTMQISFSATLFLEALRVFQSEYVSVNLPGEVKPFILEGDSDPGLIELILPKKGD